MLHNKKYCDVSVIKLIMLSKAKITMHINVLINISQLNILSTQLLVLMCFCLFDYKIA